MSYRQHEPKTVRTDARILPRSAAAQRNTGSQWPSPAPLAVACAVTMTAPRWRAKDRWRASAARFFTTVWFSDPPP